MKGWNFFIASVNSFNFGDVKMKEKMSQFKLMLCLMLPLLAVNSFAGYKIYEDAEDGVTTGWTSSIGTITNQLTSRYVGSRSIKLTSSGTAGYFTLKDNASNFNNLTDFCLRWSMNHGGGFSGFYADVTLYNSATGTYTESTIAYYCSAGTPNLDFSGSEPFFKYYLGSNTGDNTWQDFNKNMAEDVDSLCPGTSLAGYKLHRINFLKVFVKAGQTGYIDDVQLYSKPLFATNSYGFTGTNVLYEDGNNINGWTWTTATPVHSAVVYSDAAQGSVIKLQSSSAGNCQYTLKKTDNTSNWNNTTDFILKWNMKYSSTVNIVVCASMVYSDNTTSATFYYFYKSGTGTPAAVKPSSTWQLTHYLGSNANDGNWHGWTRDLRLDFATLSQTQSALLGYRLKSVQYIRFDVNQNQTSYVDDIRLYCGVEKNVITGANYNNYVTTPGTTISDRVGLINALTSAQPGSVVYVADTATIDMTGYSNTVIPAGVTLASGRGKNSGATTGGLIKTNTSGSTVFVAGGAGVRVTGLRIQGPSSATTTGWEKGIQTEYGNLEVDNCELYYWRYSPIYLLGANAKDAKIHHNYIHHNQGATGYGISCGGTALIEANVFEYNRHAIASSGEPGCAYEARYNVVLEGIVSPWYTHAFDVHGGNANDRNDGTNIAGDIMQIHHNTFYYSYEDPTVNDNAKCVKIRGIPIIGDDVYNNLIADPVAEHAIVQAYVSDWTRMNVINNYFGIFEGTTDTFTYGAMKLFE